MTDMTLPSLPPLPAPSAGRGIAINHQQGDGMDALSQKHMILIDAIINWAIANPGRPWTQCATALQFTPTWVRMVVNTDAFKARYAQMAPELLRQVGVASLKDRINAAAEVVIERIAEKAIVSESLGDLTDAAEVLLTAQFGKGNAAGGNPSPVNLTINQQIINSERDNLLQGKRE
jgi:hypothetical protein